MQEQCALTEITASIKKANSHEPVVASMTHQAAGFQILHITHIGSKTSSA
jgi:hypothetical protein